MGGVGENNFFGGGNGGDGGVGTGIGVGGNSAADSFSTAATGTNAVSAGPGQTIAFPSDNTINFPFGGVGENNFFGGGNGGNGGDGTGIGIGGTGGDTTGTGIGIGGAGGAGGNGAEFFPSTSTSSIPALQAQSASPNRALEAQSPPPTLWAACSAAYSAATAAHWSVKRPARESASAVPAASAATGP